MVNNNNGGHEQSGSSYLNADHLKKIFIGGLAPQTTEESLQSYFNKYGMVTDAVVMREISTQRSRGFGFVTFASEATVEVIQNSRPHTVDGRLVDTKRAQPRPEVGKTELDPQSPKEKKIFIGGLKDCHTDDVLHSYFSQFGSVVAVKILIDKATGRNRGFGFLEFLEASSVDKAIALDRHSINFTLVDVKKCINKMDPSKKSMNPSMMNALPYTSEVPDNYNTNTTYAIYQSEPQIPVVYNNGWGNYYPQSPINYAPQPQISYNPAYNANGGWATNSYTTQQPYISAWPQNNYTTTTTTPIQSSAINPNPQFFGDYKQQTYNGGPQKGNILQAKRVNPYGNASASPNFGGNYSHSFSNSTSNSRQRMPTHSDTYHAGHDRSDECERWVN